MSKTHYRKVFKSDHLGSADLEEFLEDGKKLVFTIKEVKQEIGATVAGKKINANIAYFVEKIKPLVLNATNSKIVKNLAKSPFVEDWQNIAVELFIDHSVKMKGEIVGGVRIKSQPPKQLSKREVSELIKKATSINDLTSIRQDILKNGLTEMANNKVNEING